MVATKVGFLNSDWSVLHHHSDWSIPKPSKVKRSGKKERAHDGLMATIWTWSLLMTSSDNSKSPSARLENLLEKTFVENFRKWAAEIWFNLIAVPLNKINQKLNQHNPAACSFFHRVNNWFPNSISSRELWNEIVKLLFTNDFDDRKSLLKNKQLVDRHVTSKYLKVQFYQNPE